MSPTATLNNSNQFKVIQTKKSTPPAQGLGSAVGCIAVVIEDGHIMNPIDAINSFVTMQHCNLVTLPLSRFTHFVAPKSDEGGFGVIRSYSEVIGATKA
jgi:hypothetical protein